MTWDRVHEKGIFDCAAVTECYQRKESIMPQQALVPANSEVALKHTRLLARSLMAKEGTDSSAFTSAAFEQGVDARGNGRVRGLPEPADSTL
jgi:hypothetical protein